MAKTAKALREQKAKVETQIQEYRDKITVDDYEVTGEDKTSFERMKTEYTGLETEIRDLESIDSILAKRNDPNHSGDPAGELRQEPEKKSKRTDPKAPLSFSERSRAIDCFLRSFSGSSDLQGEDRELVGRAQKQGVIVARGRGGYDIDIGAGPNNFEDMQRQARNGQSIESRDLAFGDGAGSVGSQGDSNVFLNELERNMLTHGTVSQVARVIRTGHGRKFSAPTVDDTSNEADIVGEAADVSAKQDPTFGDQEWPTYKLRSKKIVYSPESEEDVEYNLPGLLGSLCGERIGRGGNRYWTNGTGTGQPEGLTVGAPAGVTITAASLSTDTALTDAIIKLCHSVDPAYRSPSSGFMMNDAILGQIMTLKTTDGQYLYRFTEGGSARVYNKAAVINNHMDSVLTAGKIPILYGDYSHYWVRIVRQVRVRRYVELHGDNDQDALQCFLRIGGKLRTAGQAAVKKLVLS